MKKLTTEMIQKASKIAVRNSKEAIKNMSSERRWIFKAMEACNRANEVRYDRSEKEIEKLRKLLQKGGTNE